MTSVNPDLDRFLAKVVLDMDSRSCWVWTGAKSGGGYGKFHYRGRDVQAHRWMYERAKGSIPKGYQIDHLCRRKDCVNPEHLQAVTAGENQRRAGPYQPGARKTHCKRGHPYDENNTAWTTNGKGGQRRICGTCRREAVRRHRRWERILDWHA